MVKHSRSRPTRATPIEQLQQDRGHGSEQLYVELSTELTVGMTLRNLEAMVALGLIPDSLMTAVMRIGKRLDAGEDASAVLESIELQDVICANTIMEPEYATIDEVKKNDGHPIPGKLDLSQMTSAEIRGVIMCVMHGLEAWESFRDQQRRAIARAAVESLGDEAEPAAEERDVAPPDAEAADGASVDNAGPGPVGEGGDGGTLREFRIGEARPLTLAAQ